MGPRISPRLPPVMKDNLFSLDDGLRRGRPPPSSKNLCEGPLIDEEPAAEAAPIIDPTSISRCCIEGGLFPAVPVFFQYPCGITGGWSEWVEHELEDPINRDTLRKAAVLDAIFVSERCEIHLEVQLLRHVIRRWSSETHTFICSWGEFTPTLEDVVNILHLPIVGNQDPFNIILDAKDKERLEILKKGAMSRQSLRFSSWVKHFGDKDGGHSCSLHALVSLWLGKFVFCDFSSDYMHERVFPLALAIGRGDVIPLAPMFLGYLYRLLDQVHLLEKGAAGTMAVESFLNSSFLQVDNLIDMSGYDPSCYELEDAFSAFMVFFDSDTRILRSSDELLPLCYEFQGYETFRGAQVFPETVKSLSKFFDSYEARIESARNLSFSSKNLAFRGLGLSLYGMDVTSYSEISDHKLLCWRDTIRDAISYGLQVGFLLDILKMRLARAVFETRAACGAAISTQFLKVGATTQALKLKHQELDSECHKLRELLLEKGISSNNAGYVLEAAKGSPCNASSILYDTH